MISAIVSRLSWGYSFNPPTQSIPVIFCLSFRSAAQESASAFAVAFALYLPLTTGHSPLPLRQSYSPTTAAPPSTPVAVATPSRTARLVRQYQVRLRASRVEIRMTQLVAQGKSRGQGGAVGHHDEHGLLAGVQLHQ